MINTKPIDVHDLKVGMVIVSADKPGIDFSPSGTTVEDLNFIDLLISQGVKVVLIQQDEKAEESVERPAEIEADDNLILDQLDMDDILKKVDELADGKKLNLTDDEQKKLDDLNEIQEIHERAKDELSNLFKQIKEGYEINPAVLKQIVGDFVMQGMNKPEAMLSSTRLKHQPYIIGHSINVCILSILLGLQLKLKPKELTQIGYAGILIDTGLIKSRENIIDATTILNCVSDEIKKHPSESAAVLRGSSIDQKVIEAVAQHHERLDGSGYPKGLKGMEINPFAQIIGLTDTYDAMTSTAEKQSTTKYDILKRIYDQSGIKFNKVLVKNLINLVGALPIETLVRLNNGEMAIVFELNKDKPNHPKIMKIQNAEGYKTIPKIIDLAVENRSGLFIKEVLNPSAHGINPEEIINTYVQANKKI